ncbi:MAG: urease accessory protein UreF [Bosea sp. (in: a-proteobacteria)]
MNAHHLKLMAWLSPAFPVGGFVYSHGLEWAFEAGDINDAPSLEAWLTDLFAHGAPANDAVLFGSMWRASEAADAPALAEIAELAIALANSNERRLETVTQGNAFMLAARAAWACAEHEALREAWAGDVAYPLAVAVTAQGHDVPLDVALPAFLSGVAANLVSAAVRLGVVGQTDGQRITARLLPVIAALAEKSLNATLDDLGGAAFRSDLAAMHHETQYTRLFRS